MIRFTWPRRARAAAFATPSWPAGTMERLAVALGGVRAAIGLGALVRPSLLSAPWVGSKEAKRPTVRLFARALGTRDLALGLGVLAARDADVRRAFTGAGALADAGDAAATLIAFSALPRRLRWLVLASTLGAAGAGVALARGLRH